MYRWKKALAEAATERDRAGFEQVLNRQEKIDTVLNTIQRAKEGNNTLVFLAWGWTGKHDDTTELGFFARTPGQSYNEGHGAHYLVGEPRQSAKPCLKGIESRRVDGVDGAREAWIQTINHYLGVADEVVMIGYDPYENDANLCEWCGVLFQPGVKCWRRQIRDLFEMIFPGRESELEDAIGQFRDTTSEHMLLGNAANNAKHTMDLLWSLINVANASEGIVKDGMPAAIHLPLVEPFVYTGGVEVDPTKEWPEYLDSVKISVDAEPAAVEVGGPVSEALD